MAVLHGRMANNLNVVVLAGHLVADPEILQVKTTTLTKFSIAINRSWQRESGEEASEVSFFNCAAWGRTGETIGEFFRKGQPILIRGRLRQDTWEDKDSGKKRSAVSVVVEEFQFIGTKGDGVPRERPPTPPAQDTSFADDDVPF